MEWIKAKTIVTRTKTRDWFGTDYNMNIYRGCSHGCIYCDSRSSCYRIEDFDRVRAKENALEIIRDDLRRKVKTGVIATGAMSDPYNPFERRLELTRHALELIDAYGFGAAIATKSDLVKRDVDILSDISRHSPVIVKITVTTADDSLCQKIEPGVVSSSHRFSALKTLSENGIFAGILMMPLLPYLEDNEENVLAIIRLAAENGARFIYPAFGVTLRDNQRDWYYRKLEELFPGGGLKVRYGRRYGNAYYCGSDRRKQLRHVFSEECSRRGMLFEMKDIISAYRKGYGGSQLSFF